MLDFVMPDAGKLAMRVLTRAKGHSFLNDRDLIQMEKFVTGKFLFKTQLDQVREARTPSTMLEYTNDAIGKCQTPDELAKAG